MEEGAEARDVGRGDRAPVALEPDQPLVSEAVAGEAVGGAHADPALPAVTGEQLARGVLEPLAIRTPACVLLGVGETSSGHGGLLGWCRSGRVRGPTACEWSARGPDAVRRPRTRDRRPTCGGRRSRPARRRRGRA